MLSLSDTYICLSCAFYPIESEDILEYEGSEEDNNEMPPKPKAPTAAAKRKAGPKTTGEVEGVDYVTPSPKVSYRSYDVNMSDGWCCVKYLDGEYDYYFLEFHINGVIPEGGYKVVFADDGCSVKFKRAIHMLCFSKHHLKSIMEDKYNDAHSLVTAVDVNADQMRKDKVEQSGDYYWGAEQVVHLKERCTGTPTINYVEYYNGNKVGKYKQYNSVVTCKVQVADQRMNSMKAVSRSVVNLFDIPSSQEDSPPPPPKQRRSTGETTSQCFF